MGRRSQQLEILLTSWLGGSSGKSVERRGSGLEDTGLTDWCAGASKALLLPELAQRVRVTWNPRMRTTAGRAWWPDRSIELNPKLCECAPDETWRTLKHELAHLVAFERSGRRKIEPHGVEWQKACAELGIPGEKPFHNLPFERRKLKRNHEYVCAHCCGVIRRVRPIRRTVACYDCCRKFNGGEYHERFRLVARKA
jgi:SprT protein